MKKLISILIAAGIIATVGTVVAVASEATDSDTTISETATTEAIPESTTEEVTDGDDEATTENMETPTDSDETTDSDDSTTDESTNDTTGETVIDEYPEIPNTGTDRKIFPAIATFIVSGIALAYCLIKGKKNKLNKTKKDGE